MTPHGVWYDRQDAKHKLVVTKFLMLKKNLSVFNLSEVESDHLHIRQMKAVPMIFAANIFLTCLSIAFILPHQILKVSIKWEVTKMNKREFQYFSVVFYFWPVVQKPGP